MYKGKAKYTNFDDDEEDGELKSSPSERIDSNITVTAETLKGTEIHIEDGIMIDRTESIEVIEETNDDSVGESGWMLKIRRSMLTTFEEEIKSTEGEPSAKRAKMCCFNCGGDHQLVQCPEPRDNQRIKQAANDFKEKKRLNESSNSARYHQEDTPTKGSEFRPGRISNTLREALGIGPDDIPEWIYRMRKMGFINGYPPAYLKQAIEKEERPDETLHFHLVDDEVKDGEEESGRTTPPPKINERKMIYYMGFNKTYRHLNDREHNFRIPPFDQFCKFQQDHLTEKYWAARKEKKKKLKGYEKYAARKRKAKELEEEGDVVCLQPQTDDDDCIIIDRNPTIDEGPAEPPLEANTAEEIKSIPLDIDEGSEPSSTRSQETLNSTGSLGTPVLIRKNDKGEHYHNTLPSLEAFSKGITPFQAKEEATPHRGFLKRIFAKIKSVTGTSSK